MSEAAKPQAEVRAPKSREQIVQHVADGAANSVKKAAAAHKIKEDLVVPLEIKKGVVNEDELAVIYWAVDAAVKEAGQQGFRVVANLVLTVKRDGAEGILEKHEITSDAATEVAEEVAATQEAVAQVLDEDAINALLNDVTPGGDPVNVKPVVSEGPQGSVKTTDTGPRQALTKTPSGEQRPIRGIEMRMKKPPKEKPKGFFGSLFGGRKKG